MIVNVVFVTTRQQACQMYFQSNFGSGVLELQDKLYEVTTNVISEFTSIAYHLNQCNAMQWQFSKL